MYAIFSILSLGQQIRGSRNATVVRPGTAFLSLYNHLPFVILSGCLTIGRVEDVEPLNVLRDHTVMFEGVAKDTIIL